MGKRMFIMVWKILPILIFCSTKFLVLFLLLSDSVVSVHGIPQILQFQFTGFLRFGSFSSWDSSDSVVSVHGIPQILQFQFMGFLRFGSFSSRGSSDSVVLVHGIPQILQFKFTGFLRFCSFSPGIPQILLFQSWDSSDSVV